VFFEGSIRDNLCLFGPRLPDRRIWAALESADADDVVSGLPGGLDSPLPGDDGGLSGGQRQRLAIARMLLYSPDLILLDEPVNSLDPRSAAVVGRSLSSACSGRTVLLISHGAAVPIAVDRELILDGGSLTERRAGVTR
jgi:ABC-type bacteriocin/lantibiotic exporter with double-glycine peptidase domain